MMDSLNFEKWQGLGNDFVIVSQSTIPEEKFSKWAVLLCDRRFGIGADGLIQITSSQKADFKMVIKNSDGSSADMCGNGLRCCIASAYQSGRISKTEMIVETDAGIKEGQIYVNAKDEIESITVNMGTPIWEPEKIPFLAKGRGVKEVLLMVGEEEFKVTVMNTGVPHAVLFVESFDWNWQQIGQKLMVHPDFPQKTNVNFIQVVSPDHLIMKVWERGAGPTLACGTGACASAVAAAATGRTNRKVKVTLDGGDLEIFWKENDDIWMTGKAELSFEGKTSIVK